MATAHKLPSGSWRVFAYVGMVDGKRQHKSFTAPTKKEAEYKAALYAVRRKRAGTSLTVGEAIDRFIQSKAAVLSPKTIREYLGIRKRAFQGLMPTRLDRLTDEQLQAAVSDYSRGLSPKTVRNAVALLTSSIRLFRADFAPVLSFPQRTRAEMSIPDDNAVKRLLTASGGVLHTALLLSAALGLRRSEICALAWQDVDMAKRTLRVSRAQVINSDNAWVSKTTKTTSSTRTLDLPQIVLDHLAQLPHDDPRIVPATPDSITFRFISLRNKLGLTVRFHDLRHYYASTLLEMGVPDLYAMRRMGHATPNMLKAVYQHLKDEREQAISREIDAKMTGLFAADS
jgi:integrase